MINFIKQNLYIFYIGIILTIVNVNVLMWQWWVIVIPTIIFVKISEKN